MSEEAQPMFEAEIAKMNDVKMAVAEYASKNQTPSILTMARQHMDHLDAAYLFLSSLARHVQMQDAMVDQKVAAGEVTTFPGGGNAPEA